MNEIKPSVVFLSADNISKNSGSTTCSVDALFGVKIFSICRGPKNELLATTDSGIFDLCSNMFLSKGLFKKMSCGNGYFVGMSFEDELYTWGDGKFGELGLGIHRVIVDLPTNVPSMKNVISVACGDNHSLIIDKKRNCFSWGQLGLYEKDSFQLSKRGGYLEEMSFQPRILPFSVKNLIAEVSCGPSFSVAVTMNGKVFSWGSGESGQLGTGRCTYCETPQEVLLDENIMSLNDSIVHVACGFQHTLVSSRQGCLYGWGFNKRGELGVGDSITRHSPCKIDVYGLDCGVKKLAAGGHSSALIDELGRLYTWGSIENGRLMLNQQDLAQLSSYGPNNDGLGEFQKTVHVSRPCLVTSLQGCVVFDFAFSKNKSACLVYSQILKVYPTSIPQKSCNEVRIFGCGFYPSEHVIVRFTTKNVESGLAPRSCPGRVLDASTIICKPPKLNSLGPFEVAVSLDGVEFMPDTLTIDVYRDISAVSLAPTLVDRRSLSSGAVDCFLTVNNMDAIDLSTKIFVRMAISAFSSAGKQDITQNATGLLIVEEIQEAPMTHHDSTSDIGDTQSDTRSEVSFGGAAPPSMSKTIRKVHFSMDLSSYGNVLLTMRAQVSLNGVDYCALSPVSSTLIVHAFSPKRLSQQLIVADEPSSSNASSRQVELIGESFIPEVCLPQGMAVMAEITLVIDKTKNVKVVEYIPVICNNATSILLTMPTLSHLKSLQTSNKKSGTASSSTTPVSIRFVLDTPQNGLKSQKDSESNNNNNNNITLENSISQPTSVASNASKNSKASGSALNTASVGSSVKSKKSQESNNAANPAASVASASVGDNLSLDSNRQYLSEDPLKMLMIPSSALAISATPNVWRRSSPNVSQCQIKQKNGRPFDFLSDKVSLGLFSSEKNQVVLPIAASSYYNSATNTALPVDSSMNLATYIGKEYVIQFDIPSFDKLKMDYDAYQTLQSQGLEATSGDSKEGSSDPDNALKSTFPSSASPPLYDSSLDQSEIYLALSYSSDINPTSSDVGNMSLIHIFDGVTFPDQIPVPKGGAVSGSVINVPVQGLQSWMTTSMVRLSGHSSDSFVDCVHELKMDTSSVAITIPDATQLANITPETKGKEKLYRLHLSIDGGITFDSTSGCILQIK